MAFLSVAPNENTKSGLLPTLAGSSPAKTGILPGLAMGVKAAGPAVSSPSTTLTPNQTSSVGKNITLTPTADIQKKLGVSSDGIYGNQTTKAVRDFQTKNNLKVDGIVGPETHQALMGNPPPAPTPPTPPVPPTPPPVPPVPPTDTTKTGTTSTDTGYTNDNGLFGKLVTGLANNYGTNPGQAYSDATTHYNEIAKKLADYDAETARLNQNIEGQPGVDMHSVIGQGANLARTRAAERASIAGELQSASNVLGASNTQQQLQQGALGTAAGFAAPQGYGLTTQPFNPTTGTFTGGTNGAIDRATNAANIGSAQDFQTKINDIQAKAPAADAALNVLNSYAQAIGGGGNSPIIQGLQQFYGSTVQGTQAVAGFKAQLQAVREAWTAIEGGDGTAAIPDNITAAMLKQVQQQLKIDSQNKVTGYQKQLDTLKNAGGSNNSSSSTTAKPNPWK